MGIAARIHRWRHAEEEGAVAIYPGRWKLPLLLRSLATVFVVVMIALTQQLTLTLVAAAALFIIEALMLLGERRRAMIFKTATVVYRPLFGEPHVVAFRKITGLRRVMTSLGGRGTQRGIALDLPDSGQEVWLLQFDAQSEILERLSKASGKPVTGEWSRLFG
jgi:hypothetical protein